MTITSFDNEKIKTYMKLKDRKYRDKLGLFLVEGTHSVIEAYRAGSLQEVILESDELVPITAPTVIVSVEIMKKLCETTSPVHVLGLCKKKEVTELGNRILLLDGVQDPGNLGTIIRSAAAFEVDTVVLGKGTVDLYNPKTLRSTQGMVFHVNTMRASLEEVIAKLKEQDIPIYGTKVEYGDDVRSLSMRDMNSFALIMGNEGAGVRPEILELCDKFLYIPMSSKVESLNVAVASSILLYEFYTKRMDEEQ